MTSAVGLLGCGDNIEPKEVETPTSGIYNPNHSAARNWNEALLAAIRRDLSRPTVHARNLFHSSALMYDLWAIYDNEAEPYFLSDTVKSVNCSVSADDRASLREASQDANADRSIAITYAMHRLLTHRFQQSPGTLFQTAVFRDLFLVMNGDPDFMSTDFSVGTPQTRAAALGLYAADCVIAYGLQDGSNEANNYANTIYTPINLPLKPEKPGNPDIEDPDHWQPLQLRQAIDQAGNVVESQPVFVGAEWGSVAPFAIRNDDCTTSSRDGFDWRLCHDPGPPAYLRGDEAIPGEYQWNHSLVVYWSSHLDPSDGVMVDISPATMGNAGPLPQDIPSLQSYYNSFDGGVNDSGHTLNPYTNAPYEPNLVPRGDYTRVLAEFWADGPASETPPGHWFTIINEAVNDHPALERRYKGLGEELDQLEWEVKIYFVLGAGLHDAAVTTWGAKGWYDYVRPISAIRFMAAKGQSTDDQLPSYDPEGLPLVDDFVELVAEDDPLAGDGGENVGKIKVYAWRGPAYIDDAAVDISGVGWILAENWWSYQRPTFVSPPFAGYFSGHSAFSRTAAELVTAFTGDSYFPGGMGGFFAEKDKFLIFEQGPSVDVTLQWATYRDASDQTSLSRIWGGIHPPVDDIPGRRIGIVLADATLEKANQYFSGIAE